MWRKINRSSELQVRIIFLVKYFYSKIFYIKVYLKFLSIILNANFLSDFETGICVWVDELFQVKWLIYYVELITKFLSVKLEIFCVEIFSKSLRMFNIAFV